MNARRAIGQMRGVAAAGDNQVPPKNPTEGVVMPVKPAGLTNVEVRVSLSKMAQAITMQAQDMTVQVYRQNVQRENPLVRSMANRQQEFTTMNPPIFTRSKTSEDPKEFVDEVHKIFVAMGDTNTEKEEFASYQLKYVSQTWCKMWQHSRVLGGDPITWDLFKIAFLDRFFPREMREAKVK